MAQLIVALDVPDAEQAEALVDRLYELDVIVKIGLEALYGYPQRILSYCEARDVRTFVDAKLHDIPRTVGAAMAQIVRPNVHIVNVHAVGGLDMMRAAVESAESRAAELGVAAPNVFAVTLLTSIAAEDLNELGFQGGPGENATRLAALARDAGCTGVVCSAHEVGDLKRFFGDDFLTLTPGIRPSRECPRRPEARDDPGAGGCSRRRLSGCGPANRRSSRPVRSGTGDSRGNVRPRMSGRASDLRGALAARGALLEGHFRLSSGRHSDRFVQKFRILEDPVLLESVARAIAERFRSLEPTVVVGSAVGGILLAYEVARQLGTKAIFVEKEDGVPVFRRGFTLSSADRVLIVEDVMTTGLSTRETIAVVRARGARIVGLGVIIARDPAVLRDASLTRELDSPAFALLDLPLQSYDESECPKCAAGEPLADPGSRRA